MGAAGARWSRERGRACGFPPPAYPHGVSAPPGVPLPKGVLGARLAAPCGTILPVAQGKPSHERTVTRPAGGLAFASARASVLLFCAVTFLFWASLYLYVPVLPVHAEALGASLSMVGAVIAAYAIPQLLLRIPVGVWADALGRRKPLVLGGAVTAAAGALALGLAPGPWPLFLGRALTGVAAATWVAFTVLFASYYPGERAARAIGLISFVNGAALVAATSAGGAIAQVWGFKAAFFGAAALAAGALVALLPVREPPVRAPRGVSWGGFLRVAGQPVLLLASGMSVLVHFASYAGVLGFLPVYAARLGASAAALGVLTMLALGSAAGAALGAIYAVERWGYPRAIALGALLLGGALLSVPFIGQVAWLGVAQVVNGLGRGLLMTVLMALSIRAVAPQERATAMGVYQALYSVGMLAGPLASGVLAERLGLASVFYISAALCLVLVVVARAPALPRR